MITVKRIYNFFELKNINIFHILTKNGSHEVKYNIFFLESQNNNAVNYEFGRYINKS